MANFTNAYKNVMKIEGEYSNVSTDKGGETYKGIARNRHPQWSGWGLIDSCKSSPSFPSCLNSVAGLEDLVTGFYRTEFWNKVKGDEILNQDIAEEMFDTAVNMGISYAIIFLQKSLNLLNRNQHDYPDIEADGIIGSKTIQTLNTYLNLGNNSQKTIVMLLLWMNVFQAVRYTEIAMNNGQEINIRGWAKRIKIPDLA